MHPDLSWWVEVIVMDDACRLATPWLSSAIVECFEAIHMKRTSLYLGVFCLGLLGCHRETRWWVYELGDPKGFPRLQVLARAGSKRSPPDVRVLLADGSQWEVRMLSDNGSLWRMAVVQPDGKDNLRSSRPLMRAVAEGSCIGEPTWETVDEDAAATQAAGLPEAAPFIGVASQPSGSQPSSQVLVEQQAVTVAREAIEAEDPGAKDTWLKNATYDVTETKDGWIVWVWREPATPGGFWSVMIDNNGVVEGCLRGK